ncbi:MAG: ShlB/FhaC/HecB family hemolysin secretion/activation protein [Erythrobacter sp.]
MKKQMIYLGLPACVAFACTTVAHAQDVQPDNPIVERTGRTANQPAPEFADEVEFDRPPVVAPPIAPVTGSVRLAGVAVIENIAATAVPQRDWMPAGDDLSSVALVYDGGELLDASWVERQFVNNGMIGTDVPLDRIVALVQLINRAYVENGYINTGVLVDGAPPADGGTLSLKLVYGRMVNSNLEASPDVTFGPAGRNRLSESFIVNRMPSAGVTPLNVIDIEREFRLLAENPAIETLSADLIPGARPGEARLALEIDPAPIFDLYSTFANSRSPSIGGERISFGATLRNALRPGDILSAETGFTGGRQDLIAGYEAPFIGTKTLIRVRGGFNNAAVIDPELVPLDITAEDWQIEGGFGYRLLQRPLTPRGVGEGWQAARTIELGVSLAHRQSDTTLLGRPFSFSPGAVNGRSEYTAMRLTGDFIERGISTVLAVSVTATQGLDGTRSILPNLISPDEDFRAVRMQVSYARRLTDDGLELRVRLAGQYADGILFSGERFAAGGAQTVRGYRETLVLADTGLNASVELAKSFSLSSARQTRNGVNLGRFSASVFADGAILGNREGPSAVPDDIASAGVGLSWIPSRAIEARLTYAEALVDAPLTGSRDLQDRGFSFRITLRPLELFRR